MLSQVQRSFENFAFLQAASEGCADAVRDALDAGADINTSDSSGRTILTCALTADRYVSSHSPRHCLISLPQMGDSRRVRRVVYVRGPPQCHSDSPFAPRHISLHPQCTPGLNQRCNPLSYGSLA